MQINQGRSVNCAMQAAELLDAVRRHAPGMAEHAAALDGAAAFPVDDMAMLGAVGVLAAPLPCALGGLGLGTDSQAAADTLALLRRIGEGSLSVGRLLEAHVNALRLIVRYGDGPLVASAARDATTGMLFGLWVTDPPVGGLRFTSPDTVSGRKQFCSAAGHVRRAVVTATDGNGDVRLAVANLDQGGTAEPLADGLLGMRAAGTGQMVFENVACEAFGSSSDYLCEPDFSAGAWRTSAVTLGGIDALLAETIGQLRKRGRTADPHQQARMGQAFIARETASLWLSEAAIRAETASGDPADVVAYVNLARIAVERASLDVIELVQRSLGVAAFVRPNPVERICRDLATYLRQPAPDMVLTEAAAHMMRA